MQNVTDLVSLAKPGRPHEHLQILSSETVCLCEVLICFFGTRLIHVPDILER